MQPKEHSVYLEGTWEGLVPLGAFRFTWQPEGVLPWLEVHSNRIVYLWEGTQSRQGEEGAAVETWID